MGDPSSGANKDLLFRAGIILAAAIMVIGVVMAIATAQGWLTGAAVAEADDAGSSEGVIVEAADNASEEQASSGQGSDPEVRAASASENDATPMASTGAQDGQSVLGESTGAAANTPQKAWQCSLSIECTDVFDHWDELASDKASVVPENGVMLSSSSIAFDEGATVFDVLKDACSRTGIVLEHSGGLFGGACYVEGLNGLREFDCGPQSGWTFTVNGVRVNHSSSDHRLANGDVVVWSYSCG